MENNLNNIIVVDDDRDILALACDLLESEGHSVLNFSEPLKALEYIQNHLESVALVFTDQRMPTMSGVKLYEKIREGSLKIPVLICSGDESVTELLNAKKDSVLYFIKKPYAPKVLLDIVKKVIAI